MSGATTPGPWHVSELDATGERSEYHIFIEPNVAIIERKVEGSDACDLPDAYVLAAAPELRRALQSMLRYAELYAEPCLSGMGERYDTLKREMLIARAALVKAGDAA